MYLFWWHNKIPVVSLVPIVVSVAYFYRTRPAQTNLISTLALLSILINISTSIYLKWLNFWNIATQNFDINFTKNERRPTVCSGGPSYHMSHWIALEWVVIVISLLKNRVKGSFKWFLVNIAFCDFMACLYATTVPLQFYYLADENKPF